VAALSYLFELSCDPPISKENHQEVES